MGFKEQKRSGLCRVNVTLHSLLLFMAIFPTVTSAQVFLTPEKALSTLLPEAEAVITEQKSLTPESVKRLEETVGKRVKDQEYTFFIEMKQDKPTGYAVILDMIGKERPITFMVVVNPDGTVRAVEVLVYRESQGFEIRSPRFMKQFEGKTIQSPLRAGRDIDIITGATLSSRSTAYVVKKALALVNLFYGIGQP
jgi:Na+-translocating ferredoxin:NAD+ oxidoreductase RnfG subunit